VVPFSGVVRCSGFSGPSTPAWICAGKGNQEANRSEEESLPVKNQNQIGRGNGYTCLVRSLPCHCTTATEEGRRGRHSSFSLKIYEEEAEQRRRMGRSRVFSCVCEWGLPVLSDYVEQNKCCRRRDEEEQKAERRSETRKRGM
jgi:hypothetical protein